MNLYKEITEKLSEKYEVKVIQPWHLRVENKFDVFPKNKRFFVLSTRKWENYRDIEGKIQHHLMLEEHKKRVPKKKSRRVETWRNHLIPEEKKKGAPKKKSRGFETWKEEYPGEKIYYSWVGVPEHICAQRREDIRRGRTTIDSYRNQSFYFKKHEKPTTRNKRPLRDLYKDR